MRRFLVWLPWVLLVSVIIAFISWKNINSPSTVSMPDGVKLAGEKREPQLNTARDGAVVSYNAAVKSATPAVVNIFTKQQVRGNNPMMSDPIFREFFGNQVPQEYQNQEETSLGSGVIVRSDGYILTNNHVIAQADQIVIGLNDGRRADAKIVGTDPDTDLAVIKIDLQDLPVLPFKQSPSAVGDVVLAIGNPFGVGQTVTQGIISATERSGLGINTYENFVQTDAAINPGNSGGALIDVAGNLVGVNTAIFSRTGGSLGIGFAIPAQVSQQVLKDILEHGRVVRGWLGIDVSGAKNQAAVLSTEEATGVMVMGVEPGGPAAKSGLRKGDVIKSINNQKIKDAAHLLQYVATQKPNSLLKVQLERDKQSLTLDVKIVERPSTDDREYVRLPNRPIR